jgi:hypothetical protein
MNAEQIKFQRALGVNLMRSSAFLLSDYLKTLGPEDPKGCSAKDIQRYSVQNTLKNLIEQIQFEWDVRCTIPKFNPPPDYGDKMTIAHWLDCVACAGFIDYDGSGSLATETEETDISISPSDITFFKVKLPKWAKHVIWYNR